ncbi:hypothetical protein FA13DRAFT_766019 [Coprinellus micaceus]|uniref:Uncharacterized protein n=1 Tax=Coprinellus micaceus TaxID=71717 RepID=A0A4Y7S7Y3_COPMI|nr:hypothetical protein FA13DRAFT_766019 [Coprinellus micaceus]
MLIDIECPLVLTDFATRHQGMHDPDRYFHPESCSLAPAFYGYPDRRPSAIGMLVSSIDELYLSIALFLRFISERKSFALRHHPTLNHHLARYLLKLQKTGYIMFRFDTLGLRRPSAQERVPKTPTEFHPSGSKTGGIGCLMVDLIAGPGRCISIH